LHRIGLIPKNCAGWVIAITISYPRRYARSALRRVSAGRRLSLRPVSVWETILYFVVPAAALYLGIALLVVAPRMARRPRYRVGQPWPHEPMWWTANPEGAHLPAPDHSGDHSADHGPALVGARAGAERGGARGSW
jgi:hypothetical protein